MHVRLAFATAIQTDPDVMLVDEVLSVGDESFQKKCGEKIDEIRKAGKTILLVSHSLGTVRSLCSRCLLMKRGKMVAVGETEEVLAEYEKIICMISPMCGERDGSKNANHPLLHGNILLVMVYLELLLKDFLVDRSESSGVRYQTTSKGADAQQHFR